MRAWRQLVMWIIGEMQQGFAEEVKRRRALQTQQHMLTPAVC